MPLAGRVIMFETPAFQVSFSTARSNIIRMELVALGEEAILAYFRDEPMAVRFGNALRAANPDWLFDVVPAYTSVGVFFDARRIDSAEVQRRLKKLRYRDVDASSVGASHIVPVCYERGPDLVRVAEYAGLSTDRVIELHMGTEYAVYAIGFVPGFPYLGYLPPELCGVPRLDSPRLRVEPGSVGLTAKQTGIYPLARPGGWNLIGMTPLTLVDIADGFFPIRVGDRMRFSRIDEREFAKREGERV